MKNNKLIIITLVGIATLSGCQAVNETFGKQDFHTQEFTENYYRVMPTQFNPANYEQNVLDVSGSVVTTKAITNAFNTIIIEDIQDSRISYADVIEKYGDNNVKAIKRENYQTETEYVIALGEAMSTSSSATWMQYAKYNSLTASKYDNPAINESFKRGIFSKLTDAIILCNGGGSLVRVQIDEGGMGQVFNHELISYNNFILTTRGGTNIPSDMLPKVKKAKVEMLISFYIEKSTQNRASMHTLKFTINDFPVDDNMDTIAIKLNLQELVGDSLKRASGLSIRYNLLDHDTLMPGGVPVNGDYEFALMLYEVMMPFSAWR